jgi:hypothetical protein
LITALWITVAVLAALIGGLIVWVIDVTEEFGLLKRRVNHYRTEQRSTVERVDYLSRRKPVRVTLNVAGGASIEEISKAIQTEARLNGTRL